MTLPGFGGPSTETQAPVAPCFRGPWTLADPDPLPSVKSSPTATPGSPAVHVLSEGRGTWMSRTVYRVLGVAVARRTSAVTPSEPAPISASPVPKPVADTQYVCWKLQFLNTLKNGTSTGRFEAAAVPAVLMATTFAAPTSSAIALARYFDAFIDPILIDGAD